MSKEGQFGPFFRTIRKALGLNLREFCRRNGFDPGNVSRLERGLTPPPQTQEGLEEYAKALKIKRGSERWDRFLELAAAETGRIPAGLLEAKAGTRKLPKLLRQLRGGPGHRNWVTARHLDEWAEKLEARAILPQLVRRLVHATGRTITRIEFPAGEQTQRPGMDGVVEATDSDAFVPAGRSVWEMGVNKDPAAKAETDFRKRKKQKEATYVVVTPRKWQTKNDWAEGKNKLGGWKEVRVYDSASLEEWLERAPAVDVWLARLLEIRPAGLTDIDEYWENLEELTEPRLKPEVFLASRQKEAEEFTKWLAGPPSAVAIATRSPSEAVDFVAAVIREPSMREATTARAVIVEEKEAWQAISRSGGELLIIAHPNLTVEPEMVAESVRQGHHVVLSLRQALTDRAYSLELPRVYRHDLQKALEASGYKHIEASELASKVGGSLTVLKRLIGRLPATSQPAWSQHPDASSLVPMLLVGAWEETNRGDREILERLSGRPYHELSSTANQWLGKVDPPLTRVLSRWSLVSRDDSWLLLSNAVTQEYLKRFEQVALEVLGENDPALELPPDERWMANIKNKKLEYSQALRNGVVETLALLGGRPDRVPNAHDIPGLVENIVRQLLHRKGWQRWASLSPQLPLLAEAAPSAFLEAVKDDLRQTEPAVRNLFEQETENVLFGTNPHTGLLWALENLAWNQDRLPDVSFVLARLDELILEKNRGNSPMRSLQGIFMPWYPQTTATVKERVKILSTIASKYPSTGWRLLLGLLPERFRSVSPLQRPAYRDWALTWNEGATNSDYEQQVTACADLLVKLRGLDLGRWKELIERFEDMPGPTARSFLDQLRSFDVVVFDTPARRTLSEAMRAKISRFRQFAHTDWALPEPILAELEQVQKRFEPEDAVSRNTWLFNQIWEVLAHDVEKEEQQILEQKRRTALVEVQTEAGLDGVLALAEAVRAPDELGVVAGRDGSARMDDHILPSLLASSSEKMKRFARGYVWGRFSVAGWSWATQLDVRNWSAIEIAKLAIELPFERRTWDYVTGHGSEAESHYWQNTQRSMPNAPEEVSQAVSMLLKFARPFQACFVLGMARHQKRPVEASLVLDVLSAGIEGPIAESEQVAIRNLQHYVLELLKYLQEEIQRDESKIERASVAKLEWGYLGWLDGHPTTPKTLHGMLNTDPEFFVSLLKLIFRPEHAAEEEQESSTDDHSRIENAYQLLMSWRLVPGHRDNNTVDEGVLLDWVRKARSMAQAYDRLKVCDIRIGNVFAFAPDEPSDGTWPCVPVRDAIEEIGSEALSNGFEMGIYNKRGAYFKAIDAGGNPERDYAKRYRDWADACKIEWSTTAASLRRVAEGYEREAERADAETEQRLM